MSDIWVNISPHLLHLCFFISGMIYILVILTNGFIVGVNLVDWMKGRRLMPNDEITISLGISNFCFCTTLTLDYFISHFWKEFYRSAYWVQNVTLTFDIASSFLSFWLIAWLSAYYCMKIVNFKLQILLKVKLNFSRLVRWLLLASGLASVVTALFAFQAFKKVPLDNPAIGLNNQTTTSTTGFNHTDTHKIKKPLVVVVQMRLFSKLLIIILGSAIPLVLTISSSILVLYSLFRHAQNLEQYSSVFHNPRLEAHLNAAKAVFSLLLSYVCSFAAEVAIRTELFANWTFPYFLLLTVQLLTMLSQTSVLILSNPKMKSSAWQLLPCVQRSPETEIVPQ